MTLQKQKVRQGHEFKINNGFDIGDSHSAGHHIAPPGTAAEDELHQCLGQEVQYDSSHGLPDFRRDQRRLQAIEDMGELDNTLIFYIAGDNGTSAEGGMSGL